MVRIVLHPRLYNPLFYILSLLYLLSNVITSLINSCIEAYEEISRVYEQRKHQTWNIKYQRWLTDIERWELKTKEIIAVDKLESIEWYLKLAESSSVISQTQLVEEAMTQLRIDPKLSSEQALLRAYNSLTIKLF